MLAFEKLIESIEYSNEEGIKWWEEFDSIEEAQLILRQAIQCELDERELIRFVEVMKQDCDYPTNPKELITVANKCFNILKKQLKNKK